MPTLYVRKVIFVMWMRKTLHFIWTCLILINYFVRAEAIKLFVRDPVKSLKMKIKNASRTSRRLLDSFQVKVRIKNPERLEELRDQNYMLVGNHSAYLDIFMLAAQEELVFITSVEMSETPLLGQIVEAAGCLYTDRKKKVSLPQEVSRFVQTIRSGFKVVLFPESPGTDGGSVKDFRKSLFQVAVESCCTVLPVCIRYLHLDGKPVNTENRTVISWYRGIKFMQHLWNLLAHRLEAEISFLDPVQYDPQRKRGELADLVYARVNETFHSYDTLTN